jgi:dTMP kinase
VRRANALATGGLVPDLTLLLDLAPDAALARAASRSEHDRIERSGAEFYDRVRSAFVAFASADWQRSHPEAGPIVLVDANGDEATVALRIEQAVSARWPQTAKSLAGSNP